MTESKNNSDPWGWDQLFPMAELQPSEDTDTENTTAYIEWGSDLDELDMTAYNWAEPSSDVSQAPVHDTYTGPTDLSLVKRSSTIRLLSDRSDKRLTVEELDDVRFVKRQYSREGIDTVLMTNLGHYSFEEAWQYLHTEFGQVRISIVGSILAESDDHGALVLSNYLEEARPVRDASIDTKREFAVKLTRCFLSNSVTKPSLPILDAAGFAVQQSAEGAEEIILVDTDPYIAHPITARTTKPAALHRIVSLLWDQWCQEGERELVIREVIKTLDDVLDERDWDDTGILMAVSKASLMCQGIDDRGR